MDMAIRPLLKTPYTLRISRSGRLIEVKRPAEIVKAWKEWGSVLEDDKNSFAPLFRANGFIALLAPVLPRPSQRPDVENSWSYSWGDPGFAMQLTDTSARARAPGRTATIRASSRPLAGPGPQGAGVAGPIAFRKADI
jgi:hypothetical protein